MIKRDCIHYEQPDGKGWGNTCALKHDWSLPCENNNCPDYFSSHDGYAKPRTNYDCLISKSPEEIAEYITRIRDSFMCVLCNENGCINPDVSCVECWLDYLKQEADNGQN